MLKIPADKTNTITKLMDHVYSSVGKHCDFVFAGGAPMRLLLGEGDLDGSDLDLWFPDLDHAKVAEMAFHNEYPCNVIARTDNAMTLSIYENETNSSVTVQLIYKRFYQHIDDIFKDFDIPVCRVAYWDGHIYTSEKTIIALEKGIQDEFNIVYPNNIEGAIGRVSKYNKKGFHFTEESLLRSFGQFDLDQYKPQSINDTSGY